MGRGQQRLPYKGDDVDLSLRFVRTLAGVRHFHEPVGSPIGGKALEKYASKDWPSDKQIGRPSLSALKPGDVLSDGYRKAKVTGVDSKAGTFTWEDPEFPGMPTTSSGSRLSGYRFAEDVTEKDALKQFQSAGYATINHALRNPKDLLPEDRQAVTAIDTAMTRWHAQGPIEVYRGADVHALASYVGEGTYAKVQQAIMANATKDRHGATVRQDTNLTGLLKGADLSDKGYLSTSALQDSAARFQKGVLVKIHVPKGTPAIPVSRVTGDTHGGEAEILLGHDSKVVVDSASYRASDSSIHIEAHVEPQAPDTSGIEVARTMNLSTPIVSAQDGPRMAGVANFGGKKAAPFRKGGKRRSKVVLAKVALRKAKRKSDPDNDGD